MTSSLNTSGGSSGVRVASADPHFVCLGSGRLSTGVTLHQIPVGEFHSRDPSASLNRQPLELPNSVNKYNFSS